jgi:hypothetical protein
MYAWGVQPASAEEDHSPNGEEASQQSGNTDSNNASTSSTQQTNG